MARFLLSLFLICIFFPNISRGQNNTIIDSLEKALIVAKEDTNKVNILNELGWENRKRKPEKALEYVNSALALAQKLNWDKGKAASFSRIGVIHYWQNNLDLALQNYFKSLQLNKKINNKTGIAANYGNIAYVYEDRADYAKALEYNEMALKIYEELNDKVSVAGCLISSGTLNMYQSNFPAAQQYYLNALSMFEEQKNIPGMAIAYNNIGIIYKYQKNYEKALEYFLKGLKTKEDNNLTKGISDSYTNVGAIYFHVKDFDKALEFFFKALALDEKNNAKKSMAHLYGNIAAVYRNQEKYKEALEYGEKSIRLKEELNDKNTLISSYNNMGIYYTSQKQYEEALKYHQKGLELAKELNDKEGIQMAYEGFFAINEAQGNLQKALEYYKLSTQMKDSIFSLESNKQLAEMQTKFDTEKKEKEINLLTKEREIQNLLFKTQQAELLKKRLEAETKENEIALLNKDKKIKEMALNQQHVELSRQRMATEAKTREVTLLNQDKKIQQAELTRQKMVRNSIGVGLGLVLILAFVSYKGYRTKQKAHQELEIKNKKIESAYSIIEQNRDEIAQKNKDITDSINYAKKIQQAILPSPHLIKDAIPESFVLYKPKDIVSGDFYFFANIPANNNNPEQTFIAACDCTGHGVPGAFMSMIGNDQLTHIIIEKGITKPSEILTHLNRNIKNALKQSADGSSSRDGMDIALCCITKKSELEYELQFAGAYRPLWLTNYNEENEEELSSVIKMKNSNSDVATVLKSTRGVTEISSDKTSIGGLTDENHQFKNHKINLKKGDTFYIFSDGYADQFGGEKGKKFKTSRLKELLVSVTEYPMDKQKEILDTEFESWKKSLNQNEVFEQVDDVLVIGVRV